MVHARIGSIVGNAKLETGVFAAAKGPPTSTPPQPLMPHAPIKLSPALHHPHNLRRMTIPAKINYRVLLAVDDSESMKEFDAIR